MKTYQKPTITDIRLEDSSTAKLQSTVEFCVNRDARTTGGMPCASTDNPLSLQGSGIEGCNGATGLFPDPAIVSAVLGSGTTDAVNALTGKENSWNFLANDSYDAPCAGGCTTPTAF